MAGETRIIPRAEWGALPPEPNIESQRYQAPLPGIIDSIVIHKTNLPRNFSPLALQKAFLQSERQDWDDTAYHYYILGNGTIYEGREMKYVGAHAGKSQESVAEGELKKDPDYGSIGIALAGIFYKEMKRDYATEAQMQSLKWLLGYLRERFPNIGPDRVVLHKEVDRRITEKRGYTPYRPGHTNCPGKGVSKQVGQIKLDESSP
ncbi:MAG: N-acetylmuramoyl-L-alanine amidase [Deltaproteobacteria bacterium]|nr:N-acetylmuramoyl-L-alanine amidase [Deltaproteobacteria bacterium]